MRRALSTLMLLAAPSVPACLDEDPGTGVTCTSYEVAVNSSTRLDGRDPVAWLEPYWGRYEGTLTWSAGGQTSVVMTTSLDETQPVTGECNGGRITDVYGVGLVALTSADGGVDLMQDTNVGGPFPGPLAGDPVPSAVSDLGIGLPAPAGIAAHAAIDFARYSTESNFDLEIDWPEGSTRPLGATLTFFGYPTQAPGQTDQVLVASITFP
jgi:hypothetical protein